MPTPNTAPLTQAQTRIFLILDHVGRWQSVQEIVAVSGFSRHYVTRVLGELRDQGVAVSQPDPAYTGRGMKPRLWRLA
jgi:biotin operon repressor